MRASLPFFLIECKDGQPGRLAELQGPWDFATKSGGTAKIAKLSFDRVDVRSALEIAMKALARRAKTQGVFVAALSFFSIHGKSKDCGLLAKS